MTAKYTEKRKVQLHEIGPGGVIKIQSLFNHLQGITGAHSDSIGYGSMDILKEGLTWVISRYRLSISSLPRLFEDFHITTWRSGASGKFAIREFIVTNSAQNVIMRGTSSWLLLNFIKGEPVNSSERYAGYPTNPERAIEDNFESIPQSERHDYSKEFIVRRSDLDINNHVNNSYYIAWMLDTGEDMNEKMRPVDIAVNFRGEAKYGEAVISQVQRSGEGNTFIHRLVSDSGKELTRGITKWG